MNFLPHFTKSKGAPVRYKSEVLFIRYLFLLPVGKVKIRLVVTHVDETNFKQAIGIVRGSKAIPQDSKIHINGEALKGNVYFNAEHETIGKEVVIEKFSEPEELLIFHNGWISSVGSLLCGTNGGAMIIKATENKLIFQCNDGFPDDDFNDLTFELQWDAGSITLPPLPHADYIIE